MGFLWSLSDINSVGLFSIFRLILVILSFSWFPIVLLFPILPVSLRIFRWLYRVLRLQVILPSFLCFLVFFQFSHKVQVPIFLFVFFEFYSLVSQEDKVYYSTGSPFFLLTITRFGRLAEIRWSICISKSQWSLCISFCMTYSGLCIYHLFVRSNLNFLHNSQLIILYNQSCLVLFSLGANLQHYYYYHYYCYFLFFESFYWSLSDCSLSKSWDLFIVFAFFIFTLWCAGTVKRISSQVFFSC